MGDWSHQAHQDPDGTLRVEIVDEDGARYPVARKLTRPQVEKLLAAIQHESRTANRPVKDVIRDPAFMATTILAIKQRVR